MTPLDARVLVVDDDQVNREMLSRALTAAGCAVTAVEDGMRALQVLRSSNSYDVMLLDVMMPKMDGYDVLRFVQGDPELARVPVIVISGLDDIDSVVKCLDLGAQDYMTKPFDAAILRARIGSSLLRKRAADTERRYLRLIEAEEARSHELVLNILPAHIVDRLKAGETQIADHVDDVSILFADLVGFTGFSAEQSAADVVSILDSLIGTFDELARLHGIEKIKTIGDGYHAAGGLGAAPDGNHLTACVQLGVDMVHAVNALDIGLALRVGVNVGPVIAGVIGAHKFTFDIWSDDVNIAKRLESHGVPGRVQVTEAVRDRLADRFSFEERGTVDLKNRGPMVTFLVVDTGQSVAGAQVIARRAERRASRRGDLLRGTLV